MVITVQFDEYELKVSNISVLPWKVPVTSKEYICDQIWDSYLYPDLKNVVGVIGWELTLIDVFNTEQVMIDPDRNAANAELQTRVDFCRV